MPFDYNSFLQGVQTGLRLGRVPKGRMPPVPSGRYILTESGTPIIAEKPLYGDVSVYETGVWYPAAEYSNTFPTGTVVRENYQVRIRLVGENSVEYIAQLIYVNADQGRLQTAIILGSELSEGVTITTDIVFPSGATRIDYGQEWFNPRMSLVDGLYYAWHRAPFNDSASLLYRPTDAVMFEGTTAQFEALLENRKYSPLITEGG